MRKFITLATILTGITLAAYFMACNNKSESQATSKEDSIKNVLKRGEYLAVHVAPCMNCHSKRDYTKFSGPIVPGTEGMGGEVFDNKMLPDFPGTVYARNITPDIETGIGMWTDDEIMRALTQGINKNGDTLFPVMPYVHFNRMAKEDLLSIIAYIKTLKPIKNKIPARQLMIPISMAYPGPALQKSIDGNMRPPESDPVKYGEYLVNAAVCSDCHTPMVKGQYDFSRVFGGGVLFTLGTFKVNTANITPDSATGIGAWDETRFMNKFTVYREEKGYNYDPGKANTIMPLTTYAGMTDADIKAIHAYLQTVKPVKNKVEKYPQ